MNSVSFKAYKFLGAIPTFIGAIISLEWIFGSSVVQHWIPGSLEMALNGPLLLFASGTVLLLSDSKGALLSLRNKVSLLFSLFIIFLSFAVLIEHISGIDLGIDWVRGARVVTDSNPHPGRVSPNGSLTFLLLGISLLSLQYKGRTKHYRSIALLFACAALAISLAGLLGHFLRLEVLYQIAAHNRMLVTTAICLLSLSIGTLFRLQQESDNQSIVDEYGERISQRTVVTLTVTSLLALTAGFSMMRDEYERFLGDNLLLEAENSTSIVQHTIESALSLPKAISALKSNRSQYLALLLHSSNREATHALNDVCENFIIAGLSAVVFQDLARNIVASCGSPLRNDAFVNVLKVPNGSAKLLWANGYWLQTEESITVDGRAVGTLITEQPLKHIEYNLEKIRNVSQSSDVLLCSRIQQDAVCAPTRFYPTPLHIPMYKADGSVNLPINRALLGESGIRNTKDLRGIPVMAAYMPIKPFGLAVVVKSDLATLYGTMSQRLLWLSLILITIVVMGRYALRDQVKPLVDYILREQSRMRVILQNANEAFIAVDSKGNITDWNSAAEKTFGWTSKEVMGKQMADVVIPHEKRSSHTAGYHSFRHTGAGPIINKRIEVMALHKVGHQIAVEMSVAAHKEEQGYIATAFLHDVTERKIVADKLSDSERRLRTITDNLPVMIWYVSQNEKIEFCNETFTAWLGVDASEVLGRSVRETKSIAEFGQYSKEMEEALAGTRTEFQCDVILGGNTRFLKSIYIPDRRDNGAVMGVYAMSMDITDLKMSEMELAKMARHDALTGLPNRYQLNLTLQEAVNRCRRSKRPLAIMFLDIDHFKNINDTLGHSSGDEVLKEFAFRLKSCVRVTDTVARMGGDEFIVILEAVDMIEGPQLVANKILAAVRAPINLNGSPLHITTSIGIVFFRGEEGTPVELLECADKALYEVKEGGRNAYILKTFS